MNIKAMFIVDHFVLGCVHTDRLDASVSIGIGVGHWTNTFKTEIEWVIEICYSCTNTPNTIFYGRTRRMGKALFSQVSLCSQGYPISIP